MSLIEKEAMASVISDKIQNIQDGVLRRIDTINGEPDPDQNITLMASSFVNGLISAHNAILKQPTVEQKTGYWKNGLCCSICNESLYSLIDGDSYLSSDVGTGTAFCPFCGAIMREDNNV